MSNDLLRIELFRRALLQLRSAIELLDEAGAPEQIAAHVDLGMNQLADLLDASLAATSEQVPTLP